MLIHTPFGRKQKSMQSHSWVYTKLTKNWISEGTLSDVQGDKTQLIAQHNMPTVYVIGHL